MLSLPVISSEKKRRLLWNMEMEVISTAAKNLMESVSHVQVKKSNDLFVKHNVNNFRLTFLDVYLLSVTPVLRTTLFPFNFHVKSFIYLQYN